MFAEIALFPEAASTTAYEVDKLFFFLFSVCGAVGLGVAYFLIYFSIRYRRRPGNMARPPAMHGWAPLEWFWSITPLAIFMVMFVWGAKVYFNAFRGPDDATPIYVVGKQWMWKFQQPKGQREINDLHVPINRPVKLIMTSEDVIHSFFVPAFRVHMDVLPDRYTSVWFQATKPGRYHLFCSQYCGTNHAGMVGSVIAMEPEDYQRWLDQSAEGSLALEGRKIFLKYRCVSCHSADEHARAPVLENLFGKQVPLKSGGVVTADENYIRESILNPAAKVVAGWEPIMPTFKGQVDEMDINALVAYFKSLKLGETPRRVEDYPPPRGTFTIEEEPAERKEK
jgi:cytochrome c oxidase subunit 2